MLDQKNAHLLSLRTKLFSMLVVLLLSILFGAGITVWYAQQTRTLFSSLQASDVEPLLTAQRLENALVMQKGYATYYFLSRDQHWLEELDSRHNDFQKWLIRARDAEPLDQGRKILNRIESAYIHYSESRDMVLDLYRREKMEQGATLHWKVRDQFLVIYDLCEQYKKLHEKSIHATGEEYRARVEEMTWGALAWMTLAVFLALCIGFVLMRRVIRPIRDLAVQMNGRNTGVESECAGDEVQILRTRVMSLIDDVGNAQSKLLQSREHLKQSGKMALVGKLAASVAHSIRNPLTSLKMRLFSLERSLELDSNQKEDFEVISKEISNLDVIIGNFLEFSRRPKLKFQRMSLSDVTDMTVQLLGHRLEAYDVELKVRREDRLPVIKVDPEQIKEVLANVIINACDAMGRNGRIVIMEEEGVMPPYGKVAVVRVRDNGPGVPENIKDVVFDPFFSTKDEGTGLGLAIARRIMEEHGGWIHLHSTEGQGATFVLAFPLSEESRWLRS